MGEGNVGIADYLRTFIEKCPGRALSLEIIVLDPRIMRHRDRPFWDAYRRMPAWEFARFLELADRGTPRAASLSPDPVAKEREDVEVSLRWTKALLSAS